MILTNDGELANRLAHPRYGVEKTYRALVAGTPGPELVGKLIEGIWLSDGKVRAKRARIVGTQGEATTLELVLAEGKKREIRRMLAKFGHKVMSLTRVAIGPVVLKGLPPGEHRPLSRTEIDLLRKVAAGIAVSPASVPRPGPRAPSSWPADHDATAESREQSRRAEPPRPERRGSADRPRADRPPRPAPAPAARETDARQARQCPASRCRAKPHSQADARQARPHDGPGIAAEEAAGQGTFPGLHGAGSRFLPPTSSRRRHLEPDRGAPRAESRSEAGRETRIRRAEIIGLDPKIAAEAGLSISGRAPRKTAGDQAQAASQDIWHQAAGRGRR